MSIRAFLKLGRASALGAQHGLSRSEPTTLEGISDLLIAPETTQPAKADPAVRLPREYDRAVVFAPGRFQKVKRPGPVLRVPFIQETVRNDLRIQAIQI